MTIESEKSKYPFRSLEISFSATICEVSGDNHVGMSMLDENTRPDANKPKPWPDIVAKNVPLKAREVIKGMLYEIAVGLRAACFWFEIKIALKALDPIPAEDLVEVAETEIQVVEAAAVLWNRADAEYWLKPNENPSTRRLSEPVDGMFWGLIAFVTMFENEKTLVLFERCLEHESASTTATAAEELSFEWIWLSAIHEVVSDDENPTNATVEES